MALQMRHFACHLHRAQHRKTGAGAQVRRQRDMDRATRIAGTVHRKEAAAEKVVGCRTMRERRP